MDKFSMKPAGRKLREKSPTDQRIAATLDDIAAALEEIAHQLARR